MSTEKMNKIINSKKADDRGLVMLRMLIGKLVQKGLSILSARGLNHHHNNHHSNEDYFDEDEDEDLDATRFVPEDVKEGHFAVFAMKGNEAKRFVVELESLNNPEFVRLLEEAKEEYGFQQKGALAVPCRPEELHNILQGRRENSKGNYSCNNKNENIHVTVRRFGLIGH